MPAVLTGAGSEFYGFFSLAVLGGRNSWAVQCGSRARSFPVQREGAGWRCLANRNYPFGRVPGDTGVQGATASRMLLLFSSK